MTKSEPRFTNGFGSFVCEGDSITTEHNGITYRATIERDNDSGPPDEECDGYWPSLDPKNDGYIGHKSKRTLARHMKRAQMVLDTWKNDEWFYCGIVISATFDGVEIDDHAASLWGVECNYPETPRNKDPNNYLLTVANELLGEAKNRVTDKIKHLAQAAVRL